MSTALFCLNNTYYYATAKRIVQKQKKHVRFRIDKRQTEKMPLNCSDFKEVESYIEPMSPNFVLKHEYPVEFIPRETHKHTSYTES